MYSILMNVNYIGIYELFVDDPLFSYLIPLQNNLSNYESIHPSLVISAPCCNSSYARRFQASQLALCSINDEIHQPSLIKSCAHSRTLHSTLPLHVGLGSGRHCCIVRLLVPCDQSVLIFAWVCQCTCTTLYCMHNLENSSHLDSHCIAVDFSVQIF